MNRLRHFFPLLLAGALCGQSCPDTPVYGTCDLVFELKDPPARPYESVDLRVEFRSPSKSTYLMPGFWDGGARMVVRVSPVEAGVWDYRVTSSVAEWNGLQGQFGATAAGRAEFIRPANVHHWATDTRKPHLWMGDVYPEFGFVPRAEFEKVLEERAASRFTHIVANVEPRFQDGAPDVEYFREFDARVRMANDRGIIVDLVVPTMLPEERAERERFQRYVAARYAPFNITWIFAHGLESRPGGRAAILAQIDQMLRTDPYKHPVAGASRTSSSFLTGDRKINFIIYGEIDHDLGAVEHQIYTIPGVNMANVGNADEARRYVWNALMNGQYPSLFRTNNEGSKQMEIWFDVLSRTRYWELEPYFGVDGARAVALEGTEYLIYVEKPAGPVEVPVEKHEYQVAWINPRTGERIPQKDWKGERFVAEAPTRGEDWVLHLSREGRKASMLRSYRFDSRPVPLIQEPETNPQMTPFEIAEPAGDTLRVGEIFPFALRVKRETRATRSLQVLWTAEVALDGQGQRMVGTGMKGEFLVPPLAVKYPSAMSIRVAALNANGKLYILDRVYKLVQ